MSEGFETIKGLWEAHFHRPWPRDLPNCLHEPEPGGLDAFTAGCILTFVAKRGELDDRQAANLRCSRQQIDQLLPQLSGTAEAYNYFSQLKTLVELVLRELDEKDSA